MSLGMAFKLFHTAMERFVQDISATKVAVSVQ